MAGPGVDASIPLGIKIPDTAATIGSMVGIAKGITELKRQNVALEQDTGALDARKAVSKAMMDPENHNEDGTVNLDKFSINALKADPKNYVATDFIAKAARANADMVALKSTALQLGDQAQGYIGQRAGALSLDPNVTKADVTSMLDDAVRIAGAGSPAVKQLRDLIVEKMLPGIPNDPKAISAGLARLRALSTPVAAQQPQTALVNTGAATVPVQTNPQAGPVGPMAGAGAVPNQVGPQGAEQMATDLLGNPIKVVTAPNGQKSYAPVEGSKTPPLLSFPAGENQQTAAELSKARAAANAAAATVQTQRFNNAQIVKLADSAVTGAGADAVNKFLTSVGMQNAIPGDAGDSYNKLGHFIAVQAQQNAAAMGAPTDAARATAEMATASRQWTPKAIKDATKINDALATGAGLYNAGLERAIASPTNEKSIFAVRDFQNAWAQNFDVNAARLFNAKETGDKEEYETIVKEMGGRGSARAKALGQKVLTLEQLANGVIPR